MPISLKTSYRKPFATFAGTLFLLLSALFLSGCGDVYRSIITPVTSPGGDPQSAHLAMVLSQGIPPGTGSVAQIDVSGDVNLGNKTTGVNPVFATTSPTTEVWIVNHDDNTISGFTPTISGGSLTTIALEQGAGPTTVGVGGNFVFVNEPNLNKIAVVAVGQSVVNAFVPVGVNPVAIAATPDGKKAFVVNQGDNTVAVVSTVDNTVLGSPVSVGASPVDIVAQAAGAFMYVVSQAGNSISVLDTSTNAEVQRISSGVANPSHAVWDDNLKRLYVVNAGANSITIFNASDPSHLALLKTVATTGAPLGIAVLDNGTKFYVLHGGTPGNVEVFDSLSFNLRKTIAVQNNPVNIEAAPGSTKVYVANKTGTGPGAVATDPLGNGSISIIKTLDDSVLNIPPAGPNPIIVTTQ